MNLNCIHNLIQNEFLYLIFFCCAVSFALLSAVAMRNSAVSWLLDLHVPNLQVLLESALVVGVDCAAPIVRLVEISTVQNVDVVWREIPLLLAGWIQLVIQLQTNRIVN